MILCFSSHKGSEGGEISGNRVSSNHMVINSNLILIIRYVMVILIDLISHSFPLPHPPQLIRRFGSNSLHTLLIAGYLRLMFSNRSDRG